MRWGAKPKEFMFVCCLQLRSNKYMLDRVHVCVQRERECVRERERDEQANMPKKLDPKSYMRHYSCMEGLTEQAQARLVPSNQIKPTFKFSSLFLRNFHSRLFIHSFQLDCYFFSATYIQVIMHTRLIGPKFHRFHAG